MTPSGHFPTPDEVAEVMAFLCSPRSAAVNGQTIVVDGGLSLATMPHVDGLSPDVGIPGPSTTADVTATVVQLMHQVERQPRHQSPWRAQDGASRWAAEGAVQPVGQRLHRPGAAARRPGRVRRPEPPRVRGPRVRAAQGGPGQGPAQLPPHAAGARALHGARRRAPGGGRRTHRGRARRGVEHGRRPAAGGHRPVTGVARVRRADRGRSDARPRCRWAATTSTTSGSARAPPAPRRASRSPSAARGRRSWATPG